MLENNEGKIDIQYLKNIVRPSPPNVQTEDMSKNKVYRFFKNLYNFVIERAIPLKIAGIYLLIGVLWILFSDKIAGAITTNISDYTELSIIKGWIYVFVTSAILYFLLVKNLREIHDSKKKMKEYDESFKLAMNIAKDGIWYWDYQNDLGIFSVQWAKMIGISNKEVSLTYKEWLEFVHEEDRQRVYNAHIQYLTKEIKTYEIEYRIKTVNGEYKWILSRAQAIWDDKNKAIYLAGTNTDITELKVLQKDLEDKIKENRVLLNEVIEYDKLRAEFFSNISHELRTPLNVIFSTLQLLEFYYKEGKIVTNYSKLKKYITIMKQNCYRQLKLINNLIDITRIDSGYLKMSLKNYDIVNVVEQITTSVADYIKNMNINFKIKTDIKEKIIACDIDSIERIILNLLSNAVKYTRPGGNISVSIHDKGESIAISVKDNGIGISKDKQAIIFERFRQIDNLYTRDNEGSGIGLSLVKSLVEKHNGTIRVISDIGIGSEFIVELPAKVLPPEIEENEDSYDPEPNIDVINVEFADIYLNNVE